MSELYEEPWEVEIGAMLGRLPLVEPPEGFIESALDHRPLYAGRVIGGLLAVSIAAVVASVVTGAAGRSQITPRIDDLAHRHRSAIQAGVLVTGGADVDYPVETPVEMPAGFERTRNLAAEDIRQAVYARGDESVSVFVQDGPVDWESLPAGGHTEIDGLHAWVDQDRWLIVVEASDDTVTIVGMPTDEVVEVLETIPRTGPSLWQRTQETVDSITKQLGYPG